MAKKPKSGPRPMRVSEFQKALKGAEPRSVYVLTGSDPYLLRQARDAIRAAVLGDADPALALMQVDGPQSETAGVLDALRTPPFLAPKRLVIVREADKFVQRARGALEKHFAANDPPGCLVLESLGWNASTKLGKRVAEIGTVVACEADRPDALPGWLAARAKEAGKPMSREAARMLPEYLGTDMASLLGALEQLVLYVGDAEQITEKDVDAVVARGHHERVWALCDAVGEGNLPRALELLDAFLAEGMVVPQLVGLLRREVRQMVQVGALARRMSVDMALREARVHPAAAPRLRKALTKLSPAQLADKLQALVDADLAAKTGTDDRVAMETLIHRLCGPGASRALARTGN